MTKLSGCLSKAGVSSEDAADLRAFVAKAGGDEVAGTQAYLDDLHDDLSDLRGQLKKQGFDLAPKEFQPSASARKKSKAVVDAEAKADAAAADAAKAKEEADAKVKAAEADVLAEKERLAKQFADASHEATNIVRKGLGLPTVEKIDTVDGKRDQAVVPGAEQDAAQAAAKASDATKAAEDLAKLKGKQTKMRGGKPQEEAGGMFAPEQKDLLSAIPKDQKEPAAKSPETVRTAAPVPEPEQKADSWKDEGGGWKSKPSTLYGGTEYISPNGDSFSEGFDAKGNYQWEIEPGPGRELGQADRDFEKKFGRDITKEPPKPKESRSPITAAFKRWFGKSKVVDENGAPKVVYRGDWRGDKVGDRMRVKSATSGRFYFTEDPEIASKYATGKQFVDEQSNDFENWFRFPSLRYPRERTAPNLAQAWYRLSSEQQAAVKDALMRARNSEEFDGIEFSDEPDGGIASAQHWEYEVRQARGNWLLAAKSVWLESAAIFNDEGKFNTILERAGIKAEFDHPHEAQPAVLPVYLSIQNPVDTANITQEFVDRLAAELKGNRTRGKPTYGMWDKETRSPREWLDILRADFAEKGGDLSESGVWTSIPEPVTKALQRMGYDGINDTGGKLGGEKHGVWIAFEPAQVKSIFNRGTFDQNTGKISESRAPSTKTQRIEKLTAIARTNRERIRATPPGDTAEIERLIKENAPVADELEQLTGHPRGLDDAQTAARFNAVATTPDEKMIQAAVDYFGITEDPREAGYILPDGRMLDLSGRNQGAGEDNAGRRVIDHRDLPDEVTVETGTGRMQAFMAATGAARTDFKFGVFQAIHPTREQLKAAVDGAVVSGGDLTVGKNWPDGGEQKSSKIRNVTVGKLRAFYESEGEGHTEKFAAGVGPDRGAPRIDAAALEARLKEVGLDGKVIARIQKWALETPNSPEGRYWNRLIEISQQAQDQPWTLNHEIIHAMRDLGLFTEMEWLRLKNAARNNAEIMASVRERYPDLDEEAQLEEAVADLFAYWKAGKGEPGRLQTLWDKVVAFFKAIGAAYHGGYQTAQDIFQAADTGFLAGRPKWATEGAIDMPGPMGLSPQFMMGEPTTEKVTVYDENDQPVQADQFVAPGAERSDEQAKQQLAEKQRAELALRAQQSKMRTTKPQKEGGGLFGPEKGEQSAFKFARPRPPGAVTPRITFDNAATEERFQDARLGVKGPLDWVGALAARAEQIKNGFSRHWIHLPNEARFYDVGEQLRKLEAAPQASKEQIVRILRDLTKDMDAADLELFTRKVILDDLAWEASVDHDLAFGLTPEQARAELVKVDAALVGRPDLVGKLRTRKLVVAQVAQDLVDNGILSADQIKNPNYYRHVVLEYARAEVAATRGAGKTVRTPYWQARHGSVKDINANLLEAEFDWLHKAFMDISAAKTLQWIKDSALNVRADVIARARDHNSALVQERLDADKAANGFMRGVTRTSPMNEDWIDFKRRIAIGLAQIAKQIENGNVDNIPAVYQDTAMALTEDNASDDGNLFHFLSWMIDNQKPGWEGAAMVFKSIQARKKWTQTLLGRRYADARDMNNLIKLGLAPEGYVAWQPNAPDKNGKALVLFTAKTVSEHAIDRVVAALTGSLPLSGADAQEVAAAFQAQVKDALTVGGPQYQMVLPEELADTLSNFRDAHAERLFDAIVAGPTSWWKRWQLINPRRVVKYNINNLSGDLDAVIAGSPKALRRFPQAFKELYRVMLKDEAPSARYREAVERGVFTSGISIQEIPDINVMGEFEHLLDKQGFDKPGKFALRGLLKVWRALSTTTQFRENWLRYAAYLDYADRIEAGETMDSIGYGAASREMVDAVEDNKDRAALLARALVGDYGNVSHYGQSLRKYLIPFYSWCVPADTEMLTRAGWKTYDKISIGEMALTYNVKKHITEWQPVEKLEVFDFDDELMTLENKWGHKYRWTKDHRIPVIEQHGNKRKIVRAYELKSHHKIPVVAPHVSDGESALTANEAAMLGWIVTDGYFRRRGNSVEAMIYQSPLKHAAAIRKAFAGSITSEGTHPETGVLCFRLSANATRRIFEVFKSKDDLPGLVTRLSPPAMAAMYEAMMMGEGTVGNRCAQFPQNAGPVLDAFQILCYLLGKAAHIRSRKAGNGTQAMAYVKSRDKISVHKWDRGNERYSGKIWCPVTKNSTWVMRQNGCVLVTGNTEINTKRYWRLGANAYGQGIGRGLATSGYIGATLGVKTTAWLGVRALAVIVAVNLWNLLLFGDDEDKLDELQRAQLHVNLGTWLGETHTLRFQGALSDFLGWIGYPDVQATISEVVKGRAGWGEILETIAKAPIKKIASGLTPVLTIPLEAVGGKKYWPDVFEPRMIRDRWRNFAATFSLENEYDLVKGKPSRGYGQSLSDTTIYSRDVGEAAYNRVRGLAYDWLEREKGIEGRSASVTPRSTALYEWKLAQKYGDKKAEREAWERMRSLGMDYDARKASIDRASPLGPISVKDREKFKRTLTSRELKALAEAREWYKATFQKGAPQ